LRGGWHRDRFFGGGGWVGRRGGSVEIIVIPQGLKLHFKSGTVRNNGGGGGGGFNEYRINITRIAAADDKCKIDVNQAQKPEPVRGAYDLRMYNMYTYHSLFPLLRHSIIYRQYYIILYIAATIIVVVIAPHKNTPYNNILRCTIRRVVILWAMRPKIMRKIKHC